jgi:hypothetical protein
MFEREVISMGIRMKRGLRRPILACIRLAAMLPIGLVRSAAADETWEPCTVKGRFFFTNQLSPIPPGVGPFDFYKPMNLVHISGSGECDTGLPEDIGAPQTYSLTISGFGRVAKLGKCTGDSRITGLVLTVTVTKYFGLAGPPGGPRPERTRWIQSKPFPVFPGGAPIVGDIDYVNESLENERFAISTRVGGACPPDGSYNADITIAPALAP